MDRLLASVLSEILRLQNIVAAVVLAAFAATGLRALLCAGLGERLLPPRARGKCVPRWRRAMVTSGHSAWGALCLALGAVYGMFVVSSVQGTATALLVAGLTFAVIVGSLVPMRMGLWVGPGGLTGLLLRAVLVLSLLVLALATLMRAGFLALTVDKPVLLVEVTGAMGEEQVSWAPPNQALRAERLATHQVIFRRPADGAKVGEAWVFGDEIAVKGRVLRLAPLLAAAGVPNLFELQFAYNGYRTIERHNTYPHRAVPLEPVGPLAVHPMWRGMQERLLQRWESGTEEGSGWAIRAATTESTFFPLADAAGRPVKRTYRLVMTPGGLSAS